MSETEVLVHDVSFPTPLRVMLCAIGAFVGVMVTYELWRGVWPLNVTSPFFAFIILGGCSIAYAAIAGGLRSPERKLLFRRGTLEVTESWVGRSRSMQYTGADIVSIQTQEHESMDGPNMYCVEITVRSGETFKSRLFDTEATAKRHAAEFKRVLGI